MQLVRTSGSHRIGHVELVGEEFKLVDRLVIGIHYLIVCRVIDMEFVGVNAYDWA